MNARTAYVVMMETDTAKDVVAVYASASEADMSATLLAKYAPANKRFYTIEKPLFIAPSRKERK